MLSYHVHQTQRRAKKCLQHHFEEWPNVHFVMRSLERDVQIRQRLLQCRRILTQNLRVEFVEWLQDEVYEGPLAVDICRLSRKLPLLRVEVDISP